MQIMIYLYIKNKLFDIVKHKTVKGLASQLIHFTFEKIRFVFCYIKNYFYKP